MRRHRVTVRVTFGITVGLVLAGAGALTGCSGEPDLGPLFDNEGGQEVACMVHQTARPGLRYTDKATREQLATTAELLPVMRYYTANGAKPYCDDEPATDDDKAWGQVYVDLGGTAEKAASALA